MTADGLSTLFDLIGREWASDEVQSVISHYDGLKAIMLDKGCIYDFCGSGVKIFADKTGDGNEISEIYINYSKGRINHRRLAKMPWDFRIGQSQEQARALLGEPHNANIGHTYPPPRIPGVICGLPREWLGQLPLLTTSRATEDSITEVFSFDDCISIWMGRLKADS